MYDIVGMYPSIFTISTEMDFFSLRLERGKFSSSHQNSFHN